MEKTYIPPPEVANIAKRGLDIRIQQTPSNRAGTVTGIRTAYNLALRKPLNVDQIKQINRFLTRNRRFTGYPETSKARQAWYMWGGNAAYKWTNAILKSL